MHQIGIEKPLLWLSWLAACASIVLLSVYGRPVQFWVADTLGYGIAAWIIGLSLLVIIAASLCWLSRNRSALPWLQMAWFLPLFLVVPLWLERVEERLHFLTFGVYGALSMLLFRPRLALIVCLLGSAGDELLQFYLVDRVGDWRDVAMNALASLGAAYFVHISVRAESG